MDNDFSASQLEAITAAIPDPCLVIDELGTIVSANAAADVFFETKTKQRHITFVFRAPVILEAVQGANFAGRASEVQHQTKAPVSRTLNVFVAPLGRHENTKRISLLLMRDTTHEEQVERMRADFVANVSHELRTPLSSIAGFVETMMGAAKNDAKARDEFLAIMKVQAERMAALIDDLLSLSRIELSEHVAPSSAADLSAIANTVAKLLAPMAREFSVEIKLDVPPSLPVVGDTNQLTQVVHNLVENAIKYGASGQRVEIHGRTENGSAVLAVRDHGPGIAPQHVPRLTERFYRVSVQDSRTRGGTGLGLAIAKHIINRHRGKLQIESTLGQGSQFSISLPVLK
jgi:two-component system, OmpR family, phosphate regulon sensor histidine kinase PhoR